MQRPSVAVRLVSALGGRPLGRQARQNYILWSHKAHKHKHFMGIIPTLMGFIIRGFVWDIPILIFAYVLFSGPNI